MNWKDDKQRPYKAQGAVYVSEKNELKDQQY